MGNLLFTAFFISFVFSFLIQNIAVQRLNFGKNCYTHPLVCIPNKSYVFRSINFLKPNSVDADGAM